MYPMFELYRWVYKGPAVPLPQEVVIPGKLGGAKVYGRCPSK